MIFTKEEIDYIQANFAIQDDTDLNDLYDKLCDKTVESLDENDNPTSETFLAERIVDKLYGFEGDIWADQFKS